MLQSEEDRDQHQRKKRESGKIRAASTDGPATRLTCIRFNRDRHAPELQKTVAWPAGSTLHQDPWVPQRSPINNNKISASWASCVTKVISLDNGWSARYPLVTDLDS
ncbi:hypothetical protein RRG08_003854 [Elysia crispata]|uniref:Uncharacterized protein n=1 Tax=Elysia crispata TaxID=231223 RepID=A0AAE1DFK2_9GAST|nr:hypothetical protein RRG08_003854 [Elysia crispata]